MPAPFTRTGTSRAPGWGAGSSRASSRRPALRSRTAFMDLLPGFEGSSLPDPGDGHVARLRHGEFFHLHRNGPGVVLVHEHVRQIDDQALDQLPTPALAVAQQL